MLDKLIQRIIAKPFKAFIDWWKRPTGSSHILVMIMIGVFMRACYENKLTSQENESDISGSILGISKPNNIHNGLSIAERILPLSDFILTTSFHLERASTPFGVVTILGAEKMSFNENSYGLSAPYFEAKYPSFIRSTASPAWAEGHPRSASSRQISSIFIYPFNLFII